MNPVRGHQSLTRQKPFVLGSPHCKIVITGLDPLIHLAPSCSHEPNRVIDFRVDLKLPVSCDPVRISQLLSNLLGNALTYGDAATPVIVSAETSLQHFELCVANAGKPIPAAAMERLFLPFSRGSEKSDRQGLGLGLYIASEIARAHDGVLTASSTPSQTKFIFRMPLA